MLNMSLNEDSGRPQRICLLAQQVRIVNYNVCRMLGLIDQQNPRWRGWRWRWRRRRRRDTCFGTDNVWSIWKCYYAISVASNRGRRTRCCRIKSLFKFWNRDCIPLAVELRVVIVEILREIYHGSIAQQVILTSVSRSGSGGDDDTNVGDLFLQISGKYGLAWYFQQVKWLSRRQRLCSSYNSLIYVLNSSFDYWFVEKALPFDFWLAT